VKLSSVQISGAFNDLLAVECIKRRLQAEQLAYADRVTEVEGVSFHHGVDPLNKLVGIPGLWHEQCLRLSKRLSPRNLSTDGKNPTPTTSEAE
jgi:hypothetical protein